MSALELAVSILSQLPGLIAAGANVVSLIENTSATLKKVQDEGRDPNASEWDALNATIDGLRAQLHAAD